VTVKMWHLTGNQAYAGMLRCLLVYRKNHF